MGRMECSDVLAPAMDAMLSEQERRLQDLEGRLTAALSRVSTQEQRCQLLTDSIENLEKASEARAARMQSASMELRKLLTDKPKDVEELKQACDANCNRLTSMESRVDRF